MKQQLSARRLALEVLLRVDDGGAYANIELDKRLRSARMDARDRALATELVYGTLRWRGSLDRAISGASNRPLATLAPVVLNVLRLTAYQVLYLTQVPPHAAVYEGVELVKQMGQAPAMSFVNAVARRLQRQGAPPQAAQATGPGELADLWSHPPWLVERWLDSYGLEATQAVLRANQEVPSLVLRTNTLRISRPGLLAELAGVGIMAQAGLAPDAIIVAGGLAPSALPGYEQGWFVVQDESSQLVALALDPEPGEVVADLCSAPGGKATHLAQCMTDRGEVVAVELHQHRARMVAMAAQRLGLTSINVVCRDSRKLPQAWWSRFHRVLLDAPCTGTGVLRRRPDLRWRVSPDDLAKLVQLQQELLDAAARVVRPGGRLVYSTCSIEPEENTEQVVAFLARQSGFRRAAIAHVGALAPQLADEQHHPEMARGELQLLPSSTADGFFLSCVERLS